METRLTRKQVELLEMGDKYYGPNGQVWYHLPLWFKKENSRVGAFKTYSPDDLPEYVKEGIKNCFCTTEKKDGEV